RRRVTSPPDVVVVGAGPNGLAAAAAVAPAGLSVLGIEGRGTGGGGTGLAELVGPGFVSDVCSAIHPIAVVSPFLRALPLAEHGLAWAHAPACLAHPLDDGTAAILERSPEATATSFDDARDARPYVHMMAPLIGSADGLFPDLLAPLRVPRRPVAM